MRKLIFALVFLFAFSCAHTTIPTADANDVPMAAVSTASSSSSAASSASASSAAAPCSPMDAIVNATLWVQQSAEYRASALQAYSAARRALDAALADKTWSGADEEKNEDPSQPAAIVLDLDETAIDNTAFEGRVIAQGPAYDAKAFDTMWGTWSDESASRAIPGAAEFLNYAKSRGVTPFYVTNREEKEEPNVRRNIEKLGFPIGEKEDSLLMRGERKDWTSDKSSRRAFVASTHRLLLLLGDDLNDFTNAREKSAAERDTIIENTKDRWGTRWIIVPNPIYGSWERAVQGSGDPCTQLQTKVNALRK
jgi:5'-nucleotidase (lipoprotein e(P4) family)